MESLLQLFLALVLESWFLDTFKIYIFLLFYFYIRSMLLYRVLTCNKICELNSMAPKTLIFVMPKERDESESCSSQSCIEAQMHLENNDGSRDPDVEVSSITLSEAYLSRSAELQGNQGNILDKLKAVHLHHILAMEQRNASRIQLFHSYICF